MNPTPSAISLTRQVSLPLRLLETAPGLAGPILRLGLALVLFPHGAQKVLGWFGGYGFSGTMGFFTGTMHIPALLAFLAIAAEFAGSIALIAGIFTRVAAFGIAAVMAVAVTMHAQHGFFMNWSGAQKGEGIEYHLLAAGIALPSLALLGYQSRVTTDPQTLMYLAAIYALLPCALKAIAALALVLSPFFTKASPEKISPAGVLP